MSATIVHIVPRRMRKRILLLGLWLGMAVAGVRAQYDVAFSNYWALLPYYNPSHSGIDGKLNVQAAYSMQMTGFENAPATMYAGVDLPVFFLGPRHGIGVGFLNDKIGLFTHQKFSLQYAYHQPLWGGRLSAGLRMGFLSESFDGLGVDLGEEGDPAFPSATANGSAFDMDWGIAYHHNRWFAGFSMLHTLSPEVELGDEKVNRMSISPSYYLMGGYNIRLKSPLYTIHTYAMFRSDGSGMRGDITGRVAYNGNKYRLYGGLSYSPVNSVTFLLGGDFHGIVLGYSYELYTSGIGASSGTHEIVLGYQTDLNLFKKGKNKHKSVRIL